MIPPSRWNACDFVLQFHFKIAHVPGRMNTAADFLSRLDISPKEKVLLQIREDIQTTPIQVNIQSSASMKKISSIFYQRTILRPKKTFGSVNNKPGNRSTHPMTRTPTPRVKLSKPSPNPRTYPWSATTSKTQSKNSGANFTVTQASRAV